MHEVSIANALLEQVRPHVPEGHRLLSLKVEAGPFQSIEPASLQSAWSVITSDTDFSSSKLVLISLPYNLTCNKCQRTFTSPDLFARCECGSTNTSPAGSSDLRLISLEVE